MYLSEFYQNLSVTASNDSNIAPAHVANNAIDHTMMSGDFDFAEQSMHACGWTKQQAAEYVASKARQFIPIDLQNVLHQTVIDLALIYLDC